MERIILTKESGFEMIIKARYEQQKQSLLIMWMVLWTLAGLGIVYQFFDQKNSDMTVYLVVWMAFWAYFEYKVIYAYRWRRFGLERISIEDEKLVLSREISGRGIPAKYDLEWIKNMKIREVNPMSFVGAMSKSYWNPVEERLMFNYKGKEVYFGLELSDAEAKKVFSEVSKKIKTKG